MIRTCSYLRDRRGAFAAGLVLAAMAVPMPMWGQCNWNGGTVTCTTLGNVGIGTNGPTSLLDIRGSNGANQLHVSGTGNDDGAYLESYGPSGMVLSTGIAFNGSQWISKAPGWSMISAYGGGIQFLDGTGATVGSPVTIPPVQMILTGGNVGIGTTNPQYKLAVKGTIGAQDVIVTNTGWSDYVFRPGYRLRPLSEISQFIQTNGHLPDIPTEAEVKEKGISLGDMQAKLLAKVEELTLHMIQQDKENRDLREHMTQQEKENQELREHLARLDKSATTNSAPAGAK